MTSTFHTGTTKRAHVSRYNLKLLTTSSSRVLLIVVNNEFIMVPSLTILAMISYRLAVSIIAD